MWEVLGMSVSTGSATPVDVRCYMVTAGFDRSVPALAAQCAAAGAGIVQVRVKNVPARELLEATLAVAQAVEAANPATRVVVDDSVEVAAAAMRRGAHVHGVHVGQDDLPVPDVRALLGPEAIVGLTTGTLELIEQANKWSELLTYVGAGPFRPTPTKDSGRSPIGVDGYPQLVAASRVPVVAIGDVRPEDAAALASTGVAGVALVRALARSRDPQRDVRRVVSAFDAAAAR